MAVTRTKTTAKATTEQVASSEESKISQWEFIDRTPTRADVEALLKEHRDQWEMDYSNFADYVQAIPQVKRLQRSSPEDQTVFIDTMVEVWRLYVTVGGRISMMQFLAEANNWSIDFLPEPVTPTGAPGFLQMDTKLVYREYCIIRDKDGRELGRKAGMAWVPLEGAEGAALTNPYEKVETAARGRAIAAWGVGVLPGSGVASVEEVQGALEAKESRSRQRPSESQQAASRPPREALIGDIYTKMEAICKREHLTHEGITNQVVTFVKGQSGLELKIDEQTGLIDFAGLKDGGLVMLRNSLAERLVLEIQEAPPAAG